MDSLSTKSRFTHTETPPRVGQQDLLPYVRSACRHSGGWFIFTLIYSIRLKDFAEEANCPLRLSHTLKHLAGICAVDPAS